MRARPQDPGYLVKVLVMTVVHHPHDARVYGRQVRALLDAGHSVTLAAPWSTFGLEPDHSVEAVDLPRAHGRDRLSAWRQARKRVRAIGPDHDIIVVHNPELVPLVARVSTPVVWDVHEDLRASMVDKAWLPAQRMMGRLVPRLERYAERHMHLILAEERYQELFELRHPVVPNEPVVPREVAAPGTHRVVHLGRHSVGRGVGELVELASALPPGIELHLYGWADDDVVGLLSDGHRRGLFHWHGRLENEIALSEIEGSLAGLSLLHDLPNYRHSRPTKIVEYMSRGVPVITTPLPVAEDIVSESGAGLVVPFGGVSETVAAVMRLAEDDDLRFRMARKGHEAALERYNWATSGPRFVELLEGWASGR